MTDTLQLYEKAIGPCIMCGEESNGSPYWIDMPTESWQTLRPFVEQALGQELKSKGLFIPPYDKPLCGAECSLKHFQENPDDPHYHRYEE